MYKKKDQYKPSITNLKLLQNVERYFLAITYPHKHNFGEILNLFTTARHSLNILKFNINSSQDVHLSEQIFRLLDFVESKLSYKLYTEKEIQLKKINEVFKNLKEIIYN